jgi:hypothetical protein
MLCLYNVQRAIEAATVTTPKVTATLDLKCYE